jgi:hypothetical protein
MTIIIRPLHIHKHWQVFSEDRRHVGDIIRQPGSTLWSLQRKGMDRPFKRNIPSLRAAQALVSSYPYVWGGLNFDWHKALRTLGIWMALIGGCTIALLFLDVPK